MYKFLSIALIAIMCTLYFSAIEHGKREYERGFIVGMCSGMGAVVDTYVDSNEIPKSRWFKAEDFARRAMKHKDICEEKCNWQ